MSPSAEHLSAGPAELSRRKSPEHTLVIELVECHVATPNGPKTTKLSDFNKQNRTREYSSPNKFARSTLEFVSAITDGTFTTCDNFSYLEKSESTLKRK